MSQSRLEWKVGVFVFIGLVLLAVLLLQFSKGLTLFRPTYDLSLKATSVGGLKKRAAVMISGVQVGTVSDINLDPGGTNVTLTLRIFRPYKIYRDAGFFIEASGILGDQYVAIKPTLNQGSQYLNGDVAHAEEPFDLQEFTRSASGFISRIDETVKKLNEVLVDFTRIVLKPDTLTNISVAVANLRVFSDRALATIDNVDALLATNAPFLDRAGTNLAVFSDQMIQLADKLDGVVTTNAPDLNATLKNLESSTDTLKSLLADLHAGRGLAGKLMRDDQVATNVSAIVANLSITSSNLNRLGLWAILWQHKPPRTNEPPERLKSPRDQSE
jgi:phospholipid/cholesterol/gamma-HCH transport system substrate-binding protein